MMRKCFLAFYHLLAAIPQSSEIARDIVRCLVRLARRLTTRIDEIGVHDEVVGRPEVVSITSAAGAGMRSGRADGIRRLPGTPPKFLLTVAFLLKIWK